MERIIWVKHKGFMTLLYFLCISFMLTACSMQKNQTSKSVSVEGVAAAIQPTEWLLQDIQSQVPPEQQQKINADSINFLQLTSGSQSVREERAAPELLAAFVKLEADKGLFLLYANRQGTYERVYKKDKIIKSIQLLHDKNEQMLSITTDGQNAEEDSIYLIRFTDDGYKDVWSGTAHVRHEDVTIDTVVGNLQVDDEGNLIYLQLKRTLDQTGTSIMEQSSARIFTYNEKKQHYEPK